VHRRAAFIALSVGVAGALRLGVACTEFTASDANDANDASDAAEASVASPCAVDAHFLCADFNAAPYTKGWSDETITDGGALAIDPSTSVSAPSSLRASLTEVESASEAVLTKRILVTPHEVTLSFSLRVDQTKNTAANVASIELGMNSGGDGANLLISGTELETQLKVQVVTHRDGGLQRDDRVVPVAIKTGEWHAVTMIVSLPDGGEKGTLKVLLDGRGALDGPVTLRAATEGARAIVGLAHYSAVYPAHEVHLDDVVLDVLPLP
jgi:hypothetical protein